MKFRRDAIIVVIAILLIIVIIPIVLIITNPQKFLNQLLRLKGKVLK